MNSSVLLIWWPGAGVQRFLSALSRLVLRVEGLLDVVVHATAGMGLELYIAEYIDEDIYFVLMCSIIGGVNDNMAGRVLAKEFSVRVTSGE